MTKRSEHEWLGDIIAWSERLQRHIAGVDRAGFLGSEVIQDAVCKCASKQWASRNPVRFSGYSDYNVELAIN